MWKSSHLSITDLHREGLLSLWGATQEGLGPTSPAPTVLSLVSGATLKVLEKGHPKTRSRERSDRKIKGNSHFTNTL